MAEHDGSEEPVRSPWLGETLSPYGLSDEDATLRQVDSAKWRTLFGAKKTKRFVPVRVASSEGSTPEPRRRPVTTVEKFSVPQSEDRAIRNQTSLTKPLSNVIVGQSIVAVLLFAGVFYGVHSQVRDSAALKHWLVHMYQVDDSARVMPAIRKVFSQIHVTSLANTSTGRGGHAGGPL